MTATSRVFTLDEASALLPVVKRHTDEAVRAADAVAARLQATTPDAREPLESALNRIVQQWATTVESLGVQAKGLWLVDFDNGSGYYCWRHPEPAITHFHGYDEGFAGRMKIV